MTVDRDTKEDTEVWLDFLEKDPMVVCRPFVDCAKVLVADQLRWFTDASGGESNGLGCVFNEKWCYTAWEKNFIKKYSPSIEFLELYAVTVAVVLWAKYLKDKRVVIFCDNLSVVHMLNESTSYLGNCLKLIRIIVTENLKHNVRFFCCNKIDQYSGRQSVPGPV